MSSSAHPLPPGTTLAGKFRVVRLLGEGGMGAVYEIEHLLTKHRRALKLLHAHAREVPGIVERFLREASAAGRIADPHIVETFDAGTLDTGEPYVVMEMLTGETVAEILRREKQLGLEQLVDLVGQACVGVQAAHDAGIVHRDLKPENLFVTKRDGKSFVKLLDFGISKFDPALTGGLGVTAEGSALGTPYYMSPEQVRGELSLDARADVYALGVILYECAAGHPPFSAATLPHLVLLIHEGRPGPLAALRPDLPAALPELVAQAMAVNRADRFQTALALAEALRALPPASEDAAVAFGATLAAVPAQLAPPLSPVGPSVESVAAPAVQVATPASPSLVTLGASFAANQTAPPAAPRSPARRLGTALGAVALLVALGVGVALARLDGARAPTPVSVQALPLPLPAPAAAPAAPEPTGLLVQVATVTPAGEAPVVAPIPSATPSAAPIATVAPASASATGRRVPGGTAAASQGTAAPVNRPEKGKLVTDNPFK